MKTDVLPSVRTVGKESVGPVRILPVRVLSRVVLCGSMEIVWRLTRVVGWVLVFPAEVLKILFSLQDSLVFFPIIGIVFLPSVVFMVVLAKKTGPI